jgi:trk system potassium uptake protein TrkH
MADIGGLDYLDAVFETVSGLTTTGASVIKDVERLPLALVFWRSQIQWIGGLLTLLTILLLLAPTGIGGIPLNHASSLSRAVLWSDHGKTLDSIIAITRVYLATTTACFIALVLMGERPFHAITLAMMALSPGGLLPENGSLLSFIGQPATFVLALFLIVGATSIFWQRMVLSWNIRALLKHRESYGIIILTLILSVVIASLLFRAAGSADVLSPGAAFIEGIFNAASLVSTNGVETREGVFALLPIALVIFIVIVGGGAFSTAGGLKHYRIGGMIAQSMYEIRRLIYPSAIRSTQFETQSYDNTLLRAIWSYFTVAIMVMAAGLVLLNSTGISFNAAFMATIAAFSNSGPIYNPAWAVQGDPGWPVYADLTSFSKIVLMNLMILGRIEVLVVLGAFNLKYWANR